MKIVCVGSVAFDSVETPFGKAEEVLGGSGTYFSTSASFFSEVGIVAVTGSDFPEENIEFLNSRQINTSGITKIEGGKTFRWKGRYDYDLNTAHTLETHLNVFQDFDPILPDDYKKAPYLFLANIDPTLQLKVLEQVENPKLIAIDTMNFWIEGKVEELKNVLSKVDVIIINESEARELAATPSLVKAAKEILSLGAKRIIIKRGEYGALMFSKDGIFSAPAYPLEDIFDPTGAGDTFAGGVMGHIASTDDLSDKNFRKAIILGTVMASFNVEKFSLDRLKTLKREEVEARFNGLKELTSFEDL